MSRRQDAHGGAPEARSGGGRTPGSGRTVLETPLDIGPTLVEASAGTGKTWSLVTLVLRLVVERGLPVERILAVTFTNAATDELRGRIRARLNQAAVFLRGGEADEAVQTICARNPQAATRLELALADLDTMPVCTIHALCHRLVRDCGFAAGLEVEGEPDPDGDAAVLALARDFWRRHLYRLDPAQAALVRQGKWTPEDLVEDWKQVSHHPQARLLPEPEDLATVDRSDAFAFRHALRGAFIAACRGELDRRAAASGTWTPDALVRALAGAVASPGLAAVLRSRFDAALVDEFQDTDPHQWTVFTAALPRATWFVGDPKQAIYRFRGADIDSYFQARSTAEARLELTANRRTNAELVAAVNQVCSGPLPFVDPRIPFTPAEGLGTDRLDDGRPPFRLWWTGEHSSKEKGTAAIADAIAAESRRLLAGVQVAGRRLEPRDLAVLVRTGIEGRIVRERLQEAGIPAVLVRAGNVWAGEGAGELRALVAAVLDPGDHDVARALLASRLGGWDAARIAQPAEEDWVGVLQSIRRWHGILLRQGLPAVLAEILSAWQAAARLSDRQLTDLHHAAGLLAEVPVSDLLARFTAPQLGEDCELRLERDAAAMRIATMHAAKGLEWPVVFCPFLWSNRQAKAGEPAISHPETGVLAVDYRPDADREPAAAEALADDVRLTYVALTRARAATYVAFGPIGRGAQAPAASALAHLWQLKGLPPEAWHAHLAALAAASGGTWDGPRELPQAEEGDLELVAPSPSVPASLPHLPGAISQPRWQGTSFTALTADHDLHQDERADPAGVSVDDGGLAGPQYGVAVHAAFERADFSAGSWQDLADRCLRDQGLLATDAPARALEAARIDTWMRAALTQPIPGLITPLASVPRARRMMEWRFRLARGAVDPRRLAAVLAAHGQGEYAAQVAVLPPPAVAEALTGTIDLLCEVDDGWLVVDWKTNRLGDGDRERLMRHHHYILQAHLYLVAVHRHLRRCAPGAHIHGAAYAFLRALPAGWWTTRPSPECIAALDEAIR